VTLAIKYIVARGSVARERLQNEPLLRNDSANNSRQWFSSDHVVTPTDTNAATALQQKCYKQGQLAVAVTASYRGCSHAKDKLKKRRAQQAAKRSSGRTVLSKFASREQSYAAALRQGTQSLHTQAPQTDGKSCRHPVQQHLQQQDIQETGLSVQAPSSYNNDTLKIAAEVQEIMTELSGAVSEKGKIIVITKMVLNEIKRLIEFTGRSNS
jgi:hypothetical protein